MVPSSENNTMAMLCFLLAMACSFVAGTVYGMERETERHASQVVALKDLNDETRDLEKGQWEHAEYCEKDAYACYNNQPFPYNPAETYSDVPLTPSAATQSSAPYADEPSGDAMTGSNEYYPSTSETEHVESQTNAHHTILSREFRQITRKSSLELHFADRLSSHTQALHPSKCACASFPAQTTDDQYPDLPVYQPERVSLVPRKLTRENERLQKEPEKV